MTPVKSPLEERWPAGKQKSRFKSKWSFDKQKRKLVVRIIVTNRLGYYLYNNTKIG